MSGVFGARGAMTGCCLFSTCQLVVLPYAAATRRRQPLTDAQECIETFPWRDLRFHVVTHDPPSADQIRTIQRTSRKVNRVGLFAEVVVMVLGRQVQIRTERPSPDVRFEVGR